MRNVVNSLVKLMLFIVATSAAALGSTYGVENNLPQTALASAAVHLQVVPGEPDRLPMGLGLVGQPPVAVVTAVGTGRPEVAVVGYRAGKEVSRQSVTLPEKPASARVTLSAWPTEVAVWGESASTAAWVELARQAVPELANVPWQPQPQEGKARIVPTTEMLLSGPDWKLGSFPMGEGEKAHAYLPTFDDSKFRTVRVPGEVQVQMGFKGDHLYQSKELTLLNEKEWWYRKTFVPSLGDKDKVIRLLFEGVDYFATIWLNGEKLGENEGCFVQFSSFDIGSKLRFGKENQLTVKVTCPWVPPNGRGFLEYLKGDLAFTLYQGGVSVQFPFPPYRLGPYFHEASGCGNAAFPLGLFRDVKLVASGTVALSDLFVRTEKLNSDDSATLAVSGSIINHGDQDVAVTLEWKIAPDNFQGEEVRWPAQTLTLHPGVNPLQARLEVKKPQLWWTWDTGPQHLYSLMVRLSPTTKAGSDSRSVVFGIRTIERHQDMSYWLNGQRLFLKGAYYPTGGYFLSTETREDYEKDLELFRAANLNSVALLTIVENTDFFDLCDRLGIVSMLEFPMNQWGPLEIVYPDAPDPKSGVVPQKVVSARREIYIEESLRQFGQIMVQLRNHPSIIVWVPFAESGDRPYGEYGHLIRKLVEELSPGTIYHPSICDAGEHHYWEGNAGMEGWGGYQTQFDANAGFVSEYGSVALPVYESLSKILSPAEMWSNQNRFVPNMLNIPINVPAYAYQTFWEYNGLNSLLSRIGQYVDRQPRTLQEFIDDTQVYQAFIFKYATESYRRKKYHSINGTRIWSYREFTPGIHFSCVDYFHEPKMGYYALKRAQERFAINFAYKEALESQPAGKRLNIPVWVINDYRRQVPVDVRCEIFDLKGQKLWEKDFTGTIENDGGKEIGVVEWDTPARSGIYLLRGTATGRGGANLGARNTIFLKVVSSTQPDVPAKLVALPKELVRSLRVLLIGQKLYSDPIANWLTDMGVKVEVVKEETIDKFGELRDAEAIRRNYDVVWLACFNSLWKLMDDDMANGLAQAVQHGVGFIHTGGTGSFHGGDGYGALLDIRSLADVLPVKVRNRNDVVFSWFADVKDIQRTESRGRGWDDTLRQCGMAGFNDVDLKPGSRQVLTVSGRPLVVTGKYGRGKTVAFTGFTPSQDESERLQAQMLRQVMGAQKETAASAESPQVAPDHKMPEQKILPAPYATMFLRMLVEVGGEKVRNAYRQLAAQYQPPFTSSAPLFENLKDLPETTLQLPEAVELTATGRRAGGALHITNGGSYARLVRMRMEWEQPEGNMPYAMFSDNFIDLLPNENVSIAVDLLLPKENMGNLSGTLVVEGPNVETQRIPINLTGPQQ